MTKRRFKVRKMHAMGRPTGQHEIIKGQNCVCMCWSKIDADVLAHVLNQTPEDAFNKADEYVLYGR